MPDRRALKIIQAARDGNCFFHCLSSVSTKTPDDWRKEIAATLLTEEYYDEFFDENHTRNAHVSGLLAGEYATNHEVMAAANSLSMPIVVYVVGKHHAVVSPKVWNKSLEPLYLQLDQRGAEHYDLLVKDEVRRRIKFYC